MKILHSLDEISFHENSAVTVGKFDGLHMGHDFLIEKILKKKKMGFLTIVLTFDLNPGVLISGTKEKVLMTKDEKRILFSQLGVDYLLEIPFNEAFMRMEPREFIENLWKKLHMRYMAVGSDFQFGFRGSGNTEVLKHLSVEMGFELDVFSKLKQEKKVISSTYIRKEIAQGHIANANRLLGYSYFIIGSISHGNRIGSTKIGRPTINILPAEEKLLPPNGVYITEVVLGEEVYPGVTNVGERPTIEEKGKKISVETHILGFMQTVYGRQVKVVFKDFIRFEKKFNSIQDLKAQIEEDIHTTYTYFGIKLQE